MDQSNQEKLINFAKKLKEISETGLGGEKENAAAALERFLNKHKISLQDLIEDKKSNWLIPSESHYHRKMIYQVIANVTNDPKRRAGRYLNPNTGRKTEKVIVELTKTEYMEVMEKLEFYWRHFNEELEIFYNAFIQKNRLFYTVERKDEEEPKPLSPEEKARLFKMSQMAAGIDRKTMSKKLNS